MAAIARTGGEEAGTAARAARALEGVGHDVAPGARAVSQTEHAAPGLRGVAESDPFAPAPNAYRTPGMRDGVGLDYGALAAATSDRDTLITTALADLQKSDAESAREVLSRVDASRPLTVLERQQFSTWFDSFGLDLEADVLAGLRHDPVEGLDGARKAIGVHRRRLVSGMSIDHVPPTQVVAMNDRVGLVNDWMHSDEDVAIYVEDGFSLNKFDPEAATEGHIAAVAKNPDATWKAVRAARVRYTPTIIDIDGVRYQAMNLARRGPSAARSVRATPVAHLILVSRKDSDDSRRRATAR
jgi:hypothetical protein